MKKKKIIIIIVLFILGGYGGYAYWGLRYGCFDGQAENYYFEKSELKNVEDLSSFRIPKDNSIALFKQSCSIHWYKIKVNNHWKRTWNYEKFKLYLDEYNNKCSDCIFVQSFGWPFYGEIKKHSTNEFVCGSGNSIEKPNMENCIPFSK